MPRPRSFDPADALTAAQDVFWAKGYEAASVQDLVDATGLSRSSLYATFGDKHGLYLAVLDRYADVVRRSLRDLCDCDSPLGALQAYLSHLAAEPAAGGPGPLGCLLTNAAAERASCDPDAARRADDARRTLTQTFRRLVQDAQAAGESDPSRDAAALAHFLTGTVYGLHGLKEAGADADALGDVVETAMAAVGRNSLS